MTKTLNIRITFAPIRKVAANKVARKLVEERAVREVSRAVTAWVYTR